MTRRKRRANPLPRRPAANPGESFWRCSSTDQNSRSASAASRCLLAWERLLRLGALAPRKAESGPLCSRSASQTSFRPMAWVSLREEHAYHMTPCTEGSHHGSHAGLACSVVTSLIFIVSVKDAVSQRKWQKLK